MSNKETAEQLLDELAPHIDEVEYADHAQFIAFAEEDEINEAIKVLLQKLRRL